MTSSQHPEIRKVIGPWLECGFGIYKREGMFYPSANLGAWINFLKQEGGFANEVGPEVHRMTWFFGCGLNNYHP